MFSETTYVCVLRAKFEVSSIILKRFRHGGMGGGKEGNFNPTWKWKPTQIRGYATFEAEFMKKLSNVEAELKKKPWLSKKTCVVSSRGIAKTSSVYIFIFSLSSQWIGLSA